MKNIKLKSLITEEINNSDYGKIDDAFQDVLMDTDNLVDTNYMDEPKWEKFEWELSQLAFWHSDDSKLSKKEQSIKTIRALDDLVSFYEKKLNTRVNDSIKKMKVEAEKMKKKIKM
jgi:hypothetical protein